MGSCVSKPAEPARRASHSHKRSTPAEASSAGRLVAMVHGAIVGRDSAFRGPFGSRRLTYVDYTASGRALTFIEDYVRARVLPWYGNTHSLASHVAETSTRLREDAREVVRAAVHGGTVSDVVLFCGSGATAGVNRLAHILGVRRCSDELRLREAAAAAAVTGMTQMVPCPVPACGRRFANVASHVLHAARCHDGQCAAQVRNLWLGVVVAPAVPTHQPDTLALSAGAGDSDRGSDAAANDSDLVKPPRRPGGITQADVVVLVGPYAHHSLTLPW
jgi:hypothetical protein